MNNKHYAILWSTITVLITSIILVSYLPKTGISTEQSYMIWSFLREILNYLLWIWFIISMIFSSNKERIYVSIILITIAILNNAGRYIAWL